MLSVLTPTAGPSPAALGAGAPPARHRPEIQGLRAVAVLLVAAYHVWFGRVSGGVDVFLLLTGFLITGSLVRSVERGGGVRAGAFLARLLRRLSPAAGLVLAGVLAGTWLWVPRPRWRDTVAEVAASALYHENWRLAAHSVDYLARDAASPVQHFWSLAVQGQAYLVWPVLVAVAAAVAARSGRGTRPVLAAILAAVAAASFGYAVAATAADQPRAYFDTGARLWEPALGGLLALLPDRVRAPAAVRAALGWAGLAALAACGALVDVSTAFPGWAALWPTGAAALVLAAGVSGRPWGADRLLCWAPLRRVGDLAYPFYLWHWPVLVLYLQASGRPAAGPADGLAVLALSAGLAWATDRATGGRPAPAPAGYGLAVAAACLAPALVAAGLWTAGLDARQRSADLAAADSARYPGAGALADPRVAARLPDAPVYPDLTAPRDPWATHVNGCNTEVEGTEVAACSYGPATAGRTVALVGSSHVGHWFPAMRELALRHGWRLVVMTKNSCRFGAAPQRLGGALYADCEAWKDGVMAELAELRPDAVFTTATVSGAAERERVPDDHVRRWRELDAMGIGVIAVRDTPRLDFDAPECVDRRGAAACVAEQSASLARDSPLDTAAGVPDNVAFVDLTRYLCPDGRCPAVVGNVLVMSDDNHLTATYSRTLAPMLGAQVHAATGW
ncbi:acyltransferase family protein [Nocardiopsis trehalosi]|uniref:acyltransferase family protein n=1 Tax=Nocardiopsis trehalosi TaxID=109329 RepID=UPI00082C4FCF